MAKKKSKKKAKKKTMKLSKVQRMAFLNSPKLPQVISHHGIRKRWVGIGWVDEGKPTGKEVVVVDD